MLCATLALLACKPTTADTDGIQEPTADTAVTEETGSPPDPASFTWLGPPTQGAVLDQFAGGDQPWLFGGTVALRRVGSSWTSQPPPPEPVADATTLSDGTVLVLDSSGRVRRWSDGVWEDAVDVGSPARQLVADGTHFFAVGDQQVWYGTVSGEAWSHSFHHSVADLHRAGPGVAWISTLYDGLYEVNATGVVASPVLEEPLTSGGTRGWVLCGDAADTWAFHENQAGHFDGAGWTWESPGTDWVPVDAWLGPNGPVVVYGSSLGTPHVYEWVDDTWQSPPTTARSVDGSGSAGWLFDYDISEYAGPLEWKSSVDIGQYIKAQEVGDSLWLRRTEGWFRWTSGGLEVLELPDPENTYDLAGTEDDLWALVGPTVMRRQNGVWETSLQTGTWGGSFFMTGDQVFLSSGPAIWHFADGDWVYHDLTDQLDATGSVDTGLTANILLNDIDGTSPDNVWAVGNRGVVVRWDGSDWTVLNHDSPGSQSFVRIAVVDAQTAWMSDSGPNGGLYQWSTGGLADFGTQAKDIVLVDGQPWLLQDDRVQALDGNAALLPGQDPAYLYRGLTVVGDTFYAWGSLGALASYAPPR